MILVDANVLCEPTKVDPDPLVIHWLERHEQEVAVDPVILGEVKFGILLLPAGKRRRALEDWFDGVFQRVQCLEWTAETGLHWAELLARLRSAGKPMPIKDSLIAATALANGIELATLNRQDFQASGVFLIDPTAT